MSKPVTYRFKSPLSEEGQWEYGKEPPVGSRWEIEGLYRVQVNAPPQRPLMTDEELDQTTAQARDDLLDHIYEYGTTAEGILERVRKLCRAIERKVRGEE